jgi:hypothetical protein
MKWRDEIVEEVRAAREAYAAQFDYDLDRMFEDLKRKEEQNLAPRANLKPLKPARTENVALPVWADRAADQSSTSRMG